MLHHPFEFISFNLKRYFEFKSKSNHCLMFDTRHMSYIKKKNSEMHTNYYYLTLNVFNFRTITEKCCN